MIGVAMVAGVVSLAATTAAPSVIKIVVDLADGLASNRLPQDQGGRLPWLGVLLLVLAVTALGTNFLRRSLAITISLRMDAQMRNDLYAQLQRLPISFHSNWQSGQLISRAITDLNAVRRFLGFGVIFIVTSALTFTAVFVLLFLLDPLLAGVSTAMVLPVAVLTSRFGRSYRVISRQSQNQQGDLSTVVEESASGVRVVKSYGRQDAMIAKYDGQAEQLRATMLLGVRSRAFTWTWLHLLPNLAIAVITLLGGLAVIHGRLSIGGLVAFTAYLSMLVGPMDMLGWIISMLEEAATAAARVYEILDSQPDITDAPGAPALLRGPGAVSFEGVWLQHGNGQPVLADFNLRIEPGETVALVGRTGCGKTTVANLLPRLYDPTRGRVLIDGHDIAAVTLESLRTQVAVAFEDPVLFSASVRENVAMGRAGISEGDIDEALTVAQARFAFDLPWGLDTRIGEQGYTLSGGQRQRLALARAILGQPRVLVLDDPLSSVDVHTEVVIEKALAAVLRGVSALLIVHRPSTLVLADRVALMDGGSVVATGSHSELMRQNPLYRAILSEGSAELDERVAVDAGRSA